jgi:hypothetical protein
MSVTDAATQYDLWAGDTLPEFVFWLAASDGSGAADLTGATAAITIVPLATTGTTILNDVAIIFDPAGGGVKYTLAHGLSLPVGVNQALYAGQLTITFSSGQIQNSDQFGITVRRPLNG